MRHCWGYCQTIHVAAAVALVLGCSIDERTLTQAAGSNSEPGAGTAGQSAGNGSVNVGAGGTTPEPVDLPVCVYDGSIEPECRTLVDNAGFETDTTGWTAEDGSYGTWDAANASGSETTGSIALLNLLHGEAAGVAPGAARQCLPATANTIYDFAGDIFITEGQGEGIKGEVYEGQAGLSMFFFSKPDCVGASVSNVDSELVTDTKEWLHVAGSGISHKTAQSVMVRLNTLKAMRQFAFKASFDNVFVRER